MATSTASLKTVVLAPGECVILPKDAVISAVILDGAATATSSCGTLPTPSSYKCGYFFIVADSDDNSGHAMNEENTSYVSIKVGGTTYMLNEFVISGDNPGTLITHTQLNLHITDLALFEFKQVVREVLANRQEVYVYFKVPEPLFDTLELKVDNYGSIHYYKPEEAECDSYPAP